MTSHMFIIRLSHVSHMLGLIYDTYEYGHSLVSYVRNYI